MKKLLLAVALCLFVSGCCSNKKYTKMYHNHQNHSYYNWGCDYCKRDQAI